MKSRWAIYLTERFPLIPNFLIALGITMSARQLSENKDAGRGHGVSCANSIHG
jgi:hypothetical protein